MVGMAIIAVSFVLVNASWIARYRLNQAVDIDEAGYFSIALYDYHAWMSGGLRGWLNEVLLPTIQAPVTTATASILFIIFGPQLSVGFLVPVLFGGASVIVTYFLARRIAGDWFALLASLIVAASPIIVDYSRTFNFAMAATFFTTAALMCLLYSDRLRSTPWAILLGLCVGMMALSRTVTISFYPAIALAVLWCVFTRRDAIAKALANTLLAGVVALITAASWLFFSWRPVLDYLLQYGYGDKATSYGPAGLWQSAYATIQLFIYYTQLTDTLLIIFGIASLLIYVLIFSLKNGIILTLNRVTASLVSPVLIFSTFSIFALMSSSNKGTGFSAPLFPALAIIALYGFRLLLSTEPLRFIGAAAIAVACLVSVHPLFSMEPPYYENSRTTLPLIGTIPAFSSRAPIHWYSLESELGNPDIPTAISTDDSHQWFQLSTELYALAHDRNPPDSVVKMGFRTYLLNGNTISLANAMSSPVRLPVDGSPPFPGTISDYEAWLQSSPSCLLLSADGTIGDIRPAVDFEALETAAKNLGFSVIESVRTPNGRTVKLWSRNSCELGKTV